MTIIVAPGVTPRMKLKGTEKHQQIFAGDLVQIHSQGVIRTGIVRSSYYDTPADTYYLEIQSRENGYCYWKQDTDGGSVELLATGVK